MKIIQPKTKEELRTLIKKEIELHGLICNLNHIDTSLITDMSSLFSYFNNPQFNGDISQWNVSKVKDMSYLFSLSPFNCDISQWDVSNVKDMGAMFAYSQFNGDISKWNVSKVKNMNNMFMSSKFNQDLTNWKPFKIENTKEIGCSSKIPYWHSEDPEQIPKNIENYQLRKKLDKILKMSKIDINKVKL